MGIIENGVLRGGRGRLGEFVMYQCRGKTCIRTKVDPKEMKFSAGQLAQRERISSVAILYRAAKAVGLHKQWQKTAEGTGLTGYNLFLHHNLPAFNCEGSICDFDKLSLSMGKLQLPDHITIHEGDSDEWIIEWENLMPYPGTKKNDRLIVALMKREDVFTIEVPDIGDYRRWHCRAIIRLPSVLRNYTHLYCYFCSDTNVVYSRSRYFCLTPKF